jgi:hypothetical protein
MNLFVALITKAKARVTSAYLLLAADSVSPSGLFNTDKD